MITDRHRTGGADVLVQRVAAAARAGVHLVQVRERDLDAAALLALVRRCVDAVRATPARVLVNDRLDVALAGGAHGVHLRADSMPHARARAIAPSGFLIGRSIHSGQEAADVASDAALDYLMFGTVFPTASKPGQIAAGAEALAEVVAATSIPVLAIGGITAETATYAGRAGASGFAAISLFAAAADDEALRTAAGRAARAFDARGTLLE
jgi:thiamine-phosphate diphosphorylase